MDTMDTRTAGSSQDAEVIKQIALIRAHMPDTYKAIQAKAAEIGNEAFALVRRGLRGEANCFYAFERGRVVGAPFNEPDINAEIAQYMVTFGCTYVCVWPARKAGTDGAH